MPAAEFPVRIDMSDKPVIPDAEETQDDTEQKKKSHSIPASSANLATGRRTGPVADGPHAPAGIVYRPIVYVALCAKWGASSAGSKR